MDYFKVTEKKLYDYHKMKARLQVMERELKQLEEEYDCIGAVDTSREGVSRTNAVSSPMETAIVSKMERIRKKKIAISRVRSRIQAIERAVSSLSELDQKIVRLRYFADVPLLWSEVADKTGYSVDYVKGKIRVRIIKTIVYILFGEDARKQAEG